MLDQIRSWINVRRIAPVLPDELRHLPRPVKPGEQPLKKLRFIVLDLETTGLNPSRDKVIAIGAVAIEGMAIHLGDQFDLVLRRPELDISETVLIHGIGPEALTRGHDAGDALIRLLEWMNGDPILAFHKAFDRRFLEKTLRQELNYTQSHTWLDVADLMPAFFPQAPAGTQKLDHWIDHFHLDISARHHAAADALATAELTLIALREAQKQGVITLGHLRQRLKHHRRLKAMRQG